MQPGYDHDSDYHDGDPVVQEALATLGAFKAIDDVPTRYRLQNFESDVDADESWLAFEERFLEGLSYHTRKYVYGKAKREWWSYCEDNGVHPALPDPADIEDHLSTQVAEVNKLKSAHDARFRPLFRWFRWMTYSTEWPHRYNPTVMAVLFEGATYRVWATRLADRKYPVTTNE